MKNLGLAIAILGLSATPLEAALITTGTITGSAGDAVSRVLPMYTDPGRYVSYIAFSQPGDFTLRYQVIRTTDMFCDFGDGAGFVACGGDDVPVGFDLFAGPGATTASLAYAIAAPFREDYSPTQFGLVFDHAEGADFEYFFAEDGVVNYRVVTTPVPESSVWALMIGGFGLLGATLRRRKAAPAVG
jgi:hypothetical protein